MKPEEGLRGETMSGRNRNGGRNSEKRVNTHDKSFDFMPDGQIQDRTLIIMKFREKDHVTIS